MLFSGQAVIIELQEKVYTLCNFQEELQNRFCSVTGPQLLFAKLKLPLSRIPGIPRQKHLSYILSNVTQNKQ